MNSVINFFENLEKVPSEAAFIDLCKSERDYLREIYPNKMSLRSKFLQYRNYLKKDYYKDPVLNKTLIEVFSLVKKIDNDVDNYLEELDKIILSCATTYNLTYKCLKNEYLTFSTVLKYLRIKKSENTEISDNYLKTTKELRTEKKDIFDVEGYINQAVSLLESGSLSSLVLGLAALTGRRVAEIGCSASFEYIDKSYLLFSGQLKTKKIIAAPAFKIPVLTDSCLIIESLQKLRASFPQYINNPAKFHNNCSSPLSKRVHLFDAYVDDSLTAKDLRAIYAAIAYEIFCDKAMDYTVFYSKILGHDTKDQGTCLSYAKYKIKS